ncbi:hypothetical protein H0B56_18780 [Haloechinothrix sp. YIM 98757]|uniref:Uncharacterized protein n=1 Tax=Haloechinothrix aidingensis TaxID=2752311 RepID=A0A838AE52_9PSEU|nr:hypothetical protein [Haloechinothrix aidingensis]MBA0127594.1 hypothetical protein [Haloechinothrix aidingensis]
MAIRIDLSVEHTHRLPLVEIIVIVTATLAASLLRSRFWTWERLGGVRCRVVAGVSAIVGLCVSMLPATTATTRIPGDVPTNWVLANALTLAATVSIIAVVMSPLLGGGLVLLAYFVHGIVYNMEPLVRDYLPLVGYPGPDGHWVLAVALATVAVACHVATWGSTRWAHRRDHNEG